MKEHRIVLEKVCSCAKKYELERIVTCNDIFAAEEEAEEIAQKCNELFCGKHGFDVEVVGDDFVISVEDAGFIESCEI